MKASDGNIDAADIEVKEVQGFVPDIVDADPNPEDVKDLDEDSGS